MPNPEFKKTANNSPILWLILLVMTIATATTLWNLKPEQTNTTASVTPTTASMVSPTLSPTHVNHIVNQQIAAVSAAAHETNRQPITTTVNKRPDFVSELEWQTLQMVAKKSPHPDQELTRLVSNMRFNKQWEIWQSMAKTNQATDRTQRDALATQLLNDIPTAVTNLAIDQNEAQKIQQTILTDLEANSSIRQQRIAQEAERIGVKFDMQESQ